MSSHLPRGRFGSRLCRGIAFALAAAALPGCATPQGRRVAEAERTWRCALSLPAQRGRIEATVTLDRAGVQREPARLTWRRETAAGGSIELFWHGVASDFAPYDAAQAVLSYRAGPRSAARRRLELRRVGADGPAGEAISAALEERVRGRVFVYWRDLVAAVRNGALLAVVSDAQGRVHAQTRIDAAFMDEPARAAAMLQPHLAAMIATYERSCRYSSQRGERITIT